MTPRGQIATELDPVGVTREQALRAATALRHAAGRAGASDAELKTALDCVFADARGTTPSNNLTKHRDGNPLSPTDKARIRELLEAGTDTVPIATEIGCSVQAVAGVAVAWRNQQRREKASA